MENLTFDSENEIPYKKNKLRIELKLSITHLTSYGNGLYVLGSIPELGEWDISKAKRMECIGHDYWTINKRIKSYESDNRIIEYKYIVCDWDDSTKIYYKEGIQRSFAMTNINFKQKKVIILNESWKKFAFKLQLPLIL